MHFFFFFTLFPNKRKKNSGHLGKGILKRVPSVISDNETLSIFKKNVQYLKKIELQLGRTHEQQQKLYITTLS